MEVKNVLERIITSDSFPEFVEVDGVNVVSKVTVITTAELIDGNIVKGTGISQTHPDDLDMATEKVGTRIALLRSYIDILNNLGDLKMDYETFETLEQMKSELQNEIQAFIDRKTAMYERIRANRTGDMTNKVRHFAISEDGKTSVEVTQ